MKQILIVEDDNLLNKTLTYNLEFEYLDFISGYRSPWAFNKILQKP